MEPGPKILEQGGFARIFEGQHELIDHIMISHSLLAKFQKVSTGNGQTADGRGGPAGGPARQAV
ncbi:hypothetical protein [Streptomyces sp. NPDC008001]|uniref:hypothetical protein n=1 Tax=Streptomyces sp. NPDC008001 TaxID=3364804 RepID=UPI0036E22EE9